MRDQYIFDIPIYRKSKQEFINETNSHFKKRVKWIESHDPFERPLESDVLSRVKHSVIAESGGPWQFNQIVGWFRLYVEGNKIGCHPWWVDAERITRRMRKKRFYMKTFSDILGIHFTTESSEEIFERLLKRLTNLASEPMYMNRYVDFDVFQRIGPHINWRDLIHCSKK